MPFDFQSFPLTGNLAIFGAAAIAVYLAGTRLARYADVIASRTGLSKAFTGAVLLGVATSLPEIATTVTGSLAGNANLVSNNLLGGVALQVTILAIVDAIAVRGALTFFTPHPVLLFQGVMLLVLLALVLAAGAAGEPLAVWGFGLTPFLLAGGYLFTVRLSQGGEFLPRWRATHTPPDDGTEARQKDQTENEGAHTQPLNRYVLLGLAAASVILVAGWTLATTGEVLAEQTGLGSSFVGFALIAASTSLPELSTTLAMVRQRNYEMAVSNILGTNCLEVALFLLVDAVYRGGPILSEIDRSAMFAGALGMVVTGIFLVGLLERRNRTVLRMGFDSLAVLMVYATGVVALYQLR